MIMINRIIDKIGLCVKDSNKAKYQYLMKKCEKNGIENLKDPRDFIKYHKEEYHLSKI